MSDNKARDELKEYVAFTVGEENYETIDMIMKNVDTYAESRVLEEYEQINSQFLRSDDPNAAIKFVHERYAELTDNQERSNP